jgi:polyhydroxyalkanoate synthesis regulator protein
MQKAVIVGLHNVDKEYYITIEELNQMLEEGWEVKVQDPIGDAFNLLILEKD